MVGSWLQPDFVQYGCPWIFLFLYDVRDLDYPHRHAAFPARHTLPFCECFVQLALRAQTGTCIRGSVFLTTEASQLSVGISEDSGTA